MRGEIGELATSFSKIENLNESRGRIEEYGKTLEHRVGMKTQDMERSRLAMANAMKYTKNGTIGFKVYQDPGIRRADPAGQAQACSSKAQ
jgi:hypothetical protein